MDGDQSYRVVSICSLSVLEGMVFELTPTYPDIADDFRKSFAALEAIPADVFLASHAGFFHLSEKRARLEDAGRSENPFVDPKGYRQYLAKARTRFEKMLTAERESRAAKQAPDR